jgi:hypothetical protein
MRVTGDTRNPGRVQAELLINVYFLPSGPAAAARSTAS